ncbi:hypothetical protein JL09_g6752 [Pichia kudriavzevii]|uniref:Uncharacterized protein n=1 Tax=Pichia kudriavzevii TaxID=4909 RepID=A0A099NL14_PICKU|nr:hypothetical protein JL09_g6752 [Pichia kudriavzevii]
MAKLDGSITVKIIGNSGVAIADVIVPFEVVKETISISEVRQFSDLTLRYLVSPDIDKAKADLNIGP